MIANMTWGGETGFGVSDIFLFFFSFNGLLIIISDQIECYWIRMVC